MATVTMPQLGESVTEGTVLQWLKQPGDTVALDEPLCEIETEKVAAELPSPFEGTLGEILVPEGETVEVDAPLCTIEEVAGSVPPEPVAVPASAAEPAGRETVPAVPAADNSRSGVYSPVVQRLAAKHDIDLAAIAGSGRGGRVTRKDVQSLIDEREREAAAADGIPPAAAPLPLPEGEVVPTPEVATVAASDAYDVVPLSATRRKIGENMARSTAEAPQAWMMVEADVSGLVDLRSRERERFVGVDLTYLPYFAST
ncbi:MAG: E3 binding domain-containing protein, partial [Chloroflexi bacterium]|nr:E3 binding domain-containing protein [Chloroflexota bacterium]